MSAAALGLVRGGYGVVQLAAPALVAERMLHCPLDARGRDVARVLGARQLAQALASGRVPSFPVLALGVEVDLLHAASMLGLGFADRRRRRAAWADALIAASFAAAGLLAARRAERSRLAAGPSRLDQLREDGANRLARVFVPGYRPDPNDRK